MTETAIAVERLVVERAGKRLLEVEHFDVAPGERVAIVGGNGAGKTTLLEALALLSPPTAGTVAIGGRVANAERERVVARRKMGFVGTTPNLVEASVRANIALPLRFRQISRTETAHRVRWAAELFGVEALVERRAATLSAGEAARVSLARAFVTRPEILFPAGGRPPAARSRHA